MNIFLIVVLGLSLLYSLQADELHVHNRPDYLSLASNKDNENANRFTVSNFASNFMTLLGLSADPSEKQEEPLFYSSRPLQIPASTWLFHIEGLDHLSNTGIPLTTDGGFDINSIYSKLSEIDDDDAIATGTIDITSESDINNLQETLATHVSQMNKETPLKYIVIVCDDCNKDETIQKLEKQLNHSITQIIASDPQTLAMTLTTTESARIRRARQVNGPSNNVTIAVMYSDEYPVMFHLFFWTSLVFAILIISVVYVFLTLDPGADTIIYRMTAPRLKVD